MGYGPASYTTIEQTKEIHIALNKITIEDLKSRYNGKLMMELEIYPGIWNENESLEYLIDSFMVIKEFYSKAAFENQAVIIFIN